MLACLLVQLQVFQLFHELAVWGWGMRELDDNLWNLIKATIGTAWIQLFTSELTSIVDLDFSRLRVCCDMSNIRWPRDGSFAAGVWGWELRVCAMIMERSRSSVLSVFE